MGIINNDSIDTPFGTTVTGSYMAIGQNEITVRKDDDNKFVMDYYVRVWVNQDARNNNKSSVRTNAYSLELSDAQLTAGAYNTAYAHLKTVFTNSTDA